MRDLLWHTHTHTHSIQQSVLKTAGVLVFASPPCLTRGHRGAMVVRRHSATAGPGVDDARGGHRDGRAVGLVPLQRLGDGGGGGRRADGHPQAERGMTRLCVGPRRCPLRNQSGSEHPVARPGWMTRRVCTGAPVHFAQAISQGQRVAKPGILMRRVRTVTPVHYA